MVSEIRRAILEVRVLELSIEIDALESYVLSTELIIKARIKSKIRDALVKRLENEWGKMVNHW